MTDGASDVWMAAAGGADEWVRRTSFPGEAEFPAVPCAADRLQVAAIKTAADTIEKICERFMGIPFPDPCV
jgi:hypothetical protein